MFVALGQVPQIQKGFYVDHLMAYFGMDQRIRRFCGDILCPPGWDDLTTVCGTGSAFATERTMLWKGGIRLKKFFETPNLSFYRFLNALLDLQKQVFNKISLRIAEGARLPRPNKRYLASQIRIETLEARFGTVAPVEYLRGLAHCVPQPVRGQH